jgi:hypothetical protein
VPTVAETAYPRLKNQIREKELTEIYTPTLEELSLASQYTKIRSDQARISRQTQDISKIGLFC